MVGDNMNNKGFTLIELIATILILALVTSLASYSIINLIRRSKEENYNILIKNIEDGAEVYYQECKYANNSGITCNSNNGSYEITLGELVTYNYVKGNGSNDRNVIVNPKDDKDISNCRIKVSYSNGKVLVEALSPSGSCPTQY